MTTEGWNNPIVLHTPEEVHALRHVSPDLVQLPMTYSDRFPQIRPISEIKQNFKNLLNLGDLAKR